MTNRASILIEETHLYDYGKGAGWKSFPLRFALGFPNNYAIGMANLGFLWIYHILNRMDSVRCDRFFLDMPSSGGMIKTLEMDRPIRDYDVVGFSFPFEMDFINLPLMLERGGIEPIASRREFPLVVAGGIAVSANPEPIADFLDIVFVGESEDMVENFVERYLRHREGGQSSKTAQIHRQLLEDIVGDPGFYVPSFYKIAYSENGIVKEIQSERGVPGIVKRRRILSLDEAPHSPITAKYSAFSNMFLVEISRGCMYGCSFCLSRCLAQSFRAFDEDGVRKVITKGVQHAKKVGLIGTGFSSVETLSAICGHALDAGAELSFSSLRLTKQILSVFSEFGNQLRLRTITAAPETATDRLRRVIRKNIYEDCSEAIDELSKLNIKKVKLYFLVGLPGENEEDVVEIARYVKRVWKRKWRVELSVAPMVPKPFTPMQWHPMESIGSLKGKMKILKKETQKVGIGIRFESARIAEVQGIISRGDRRFGTVISETAKNGGGTTEFLRAIKNNGLSKEFYLNRSREGNEVFPWDMLEYPDPKQELFAEYKKIMRLAG